MILLDALRSRLFSRPTADEAPRPAHVVDKIHLGELWPDHVTIIEKNQAAAQASTRHLLRQEQVRSTAQIAKAYDLRAYAEKQMRPEEFQAGASGALPGTAKKGGRFDVGAVLEGGLSGDTSQEPDRAEKRQLMARRVEGGGNNALGALTAGATAMGIFFLGPLGAAAGGGSLLVDAVKGPELVFVNGQITPAQVKAAAKRFERARPLPQAITAAFVRRALAREDLDDDTRDRLKRMQRQAMSLPDELLEEGERIAVIALFGRRVETGELTVVEDEEADEVCVALVGLAPPNHRLIAPWLQELLAGARAPRLSIRASARFAYALELA